jgi:tRNA(adenine34) deaminase
VFSEEDHHWMQRALAQARLAEAQNEVPVGSVLVHEGVCVAEAFNAPIAMHDPTAHAEVQCLRHAALQRENYRLTGSTLYVSLEPCAMCFGAMQHARIARVVFAAHDPKTGVLASADQLHRKPWALHRMQVEGGLLEAEASALLKAFFQRRRGIMR